MSKKVYHLKHSTHKEQYRHMKSMMDWKADLKEQQELEAERRVNEIQDRFIEVRDELKALDPDGWSQWYDECVPDWQGWMNAQPAIDCLAKRVDELKAVQSPAAAQPSTQINWRVASENTLRTYAVAIRDFEAVTNTKVDQADLLSIQQWHESLRGRGLSQNTIRARIAAVRVMSGVQYPLPKKQKAGADLLTLVEVRAILAQTKTPEERQALMKSLSGFDGISKRTNNETDFLSHFLGIVTVTPVTAQALTRLLKRCAKKAGIEPARISRRIWTQSGAWLLKVLSPVEFSRLLPQVETALQNIKPLHGINRRSHIVKQ
jgi:Site-specific recombinase XerD